jgi:hypothetical protein
MKNWMLDPVHISSMGSSANACGFHRDGEWEFRIFLTIDDCLLKFGRVGGYMGRIYGSLNPWNSRSIEPRP